MKADGNSKVISKTEVKKSSVASSGSKNKLVKKEKNISNVIATGGLSSVFSRDTSIFDKIDLRLTIKGLVSISSFNED